MVLNLSKHAGSAQFQGLCMKLSVFKKSFHDMATFLALAVVTLIDRSSFSVAWRGVVGCRCGGDCGVVVVAAVVVVLMVMDVHVTAHDFDPQKGLVALILAPFPWP